MSFGLNASTHNLPFVSTFAEAVKAWQKIEPLRGSLASDPKPLGRRERRNPKQVRVESDPTTGEPAKVIFRYHQTDVVTWHADNTCVLDPFPSRSTAVFAGSFLPRGVYVYGECCGITLAVTRTVDGQVETEPRYYKMNGQRVTLQTDAEGHAVPLPDADQPDGTEPVKHITVNRKAANALYRKYHLKEFETFYTAFMATTNYEPSRDDCKIYAGYGYLRNDNLCGPGEALKILGEVRRDQWPALARALAATMRWGTFGQRKYQPMQLLRWLVRDAHQAECYVTTPIPYTMSYEKMRRIDNTDPSIL